MTTYARRVISVRTRTGIENDFSYLIRERIHRHAERPRQSKISQLQLAFPIDQQILRLQIPMKHPVFMAERRAHQQLVHEAAHCMWIERAAVSVSVHVLLEVAFAVLEDENEFGLGMDDIVKADDVDMLELFHE